jgi:hypothetical protein
MYRRAIKILRKNVHQVGSFCKALNQLKNFHGKCLALEFKHCNYIHPVLKMSSHVSLQKESTD